MAVLEDPHQRAEHRRQAEGVEKDRLEGDQHTAGEQEDQDQGDDHDEGEGPGEAVPYRRLGVDQHRRRARHRGVEGGVRRPDLLDQVLRALVDRLALRLHGEVGPVALDQGPLHPERLGEVRQPLLVGGVLRLRRLALREHRQAAAGSAREALAQMLLDHVRLGGGGELAVVGRAEPHPQEGQAEEEQTGGRGDGEVRGAAHDEGRRAAPGRALLLGRGVVAGLRPSALEQLAQVQGVDAVAQEDERGREEDQGRCRRQQDHRDARVGEGLQEVLREDHHRGEGDGDREGGEEDRAAGRAQGGGDGRQGVCAGGQLLAEAAHDEQGVVDREAQAHGRGEVQGEDRHVGDLGEAAQDGVGAEDRDDAHAERQQGGDRAAEDHDQQHEGHRQGDHLGPQQVLLDGRLHLVAHGEDAADLDLDRAVRAAQLGGDAVQGLVHGGVVAGEAGRYQCLGPVLRAQRRSAGQPVGADARDALLGGQPLGQFLRLGGDGRGVDRGLARVDQQQEVRLGVGELALQSLGRVGGLGGRVLPAAAAEPVGDIAARDDREGGEHQGDEEGEPGAGGHEPGPASGSGWPVDFGHGAVSPSL